MKPQRIQRRRTKGWRMPLNTVYVGRPTKWGNPFEVKAPSKKDERHTFMKRQAYMDAVDAYRRHIKLHPELKLQVMKELGGKNLACFCGHDIPCHADVLLELAN